MTCVVAPTASAQPSGQHPGVADRVADAAGDAPAGFDLASLRASVDRRRHMVVATVEMHEDPLPPHAAVSVSFGVRATDGTCRPVEGQPLSLRNSRGLRSWSAALTGGAHETGRATRPTVGSGATYGPSVARADCAHSPAYGADGSARDATPVATLRRAGAPTDPTARTAIRLQYDYTNVVRVRDGKANVSVLCLTSAHSRCSGKLTLRQQGSHRALGTRTVSAAPGRTGVVRVPLNAYARSPRREKATAVVTLRSSDAVSAFQVLELRP